jgi:hypothetical protein
MSTSNWFLDSNSPLLAAELQYFRTPRTKWEQMLLRVRQMGANTVTTSVMWGWHEPVEGKVDLSGQTAPERDLVGFIRLAQEMGFLVLLKPGPFIDAGTLGGGIPSWLLAKIPEAHAQRNDGKPWLYPTSNQPRLSYLHPKSIEYARQWLNAFSQAVKDFQWPKGPVIAIQLDNEIPGRGLTPADQTDPLFDVHFRGDYNAFYIETLWPEWLKNRHSSLEEMNAEYGWTAQDFKGVPFPKSWSPLREIPELRLWMDAARFNDWTLSEAIRLYASILREAGWQIPFYHNLLSAPWEGGVMVVNPGSLARASGWLGQNLYPGKVGTFDLGDTGQAGYDAYVQHMIWQARLLKNFSPEFPSLVTGVATASNFQLSSLFAGGTNAADLFGAVQSDPEPPLVGAMPRWGMDAPIRPDGTVRRRLWNSLTLFSYLQFAGKDFARSSMPADIILGYSHVPELASQWYSRPDYFSPAQASLPASRPPDELAGVLRGSESGAGSQALARILIQRQLDFNVLDVDFALDPQLYPVSLLVMQACALMARRTQQRLGDFLRRGGRLAWVGGEYPEFDEVLLPYEELKKAGKETGRVIMVAEWTASHTEKLVQMGYLPRYAWSDAPEGMDVTVRHAPDQAVFLQVANRLKQAYEGSIYYLDANRQIQTIKLRLGSMQVGFVSLKAGRLQNVILCGQDGAYVEAASERLAIDGGQALIARSGAWLLISSPDPVNLQLSRLEGWGEPQAWRVILDGRALKDASIQVDKGALSVSYQAEAGGHQTLLMLIAPARQPLPAEFHYLILAQITYLQMMIHKAAGQCQDLSARLIPIASTLPGMMGKFPIALDEAAQLLTAMATTLKPDASQPLFVQEYADRLQRLWEILAAPRNIFLEALHQSRAQLATGGLSKELAWIERDLNTILDTLDQVDTESD